MRPLYGKGSVALKRASEAVAEFRLPATLSPNDRLSTIFTNFAVMKILFVGDYSGFHASLAEELRRRGHQCTVVSDGSTFMDTDRDITLHRQPGFVGSVKYLYNACRVIERLRGYDVVQLINAHFLRLRPGRLSYFLNGLKRNNGHVFLSHCSTDYYYAKAMLADNVLEYSEYGFDGRQTEFTLHCSDTIDSWLLPVNKVWADTLYEEVDGAVSALYEYHKVWQPIFGDRLNYVGIGVDTRRLAYSPIPAGGPLRVLVAIKPNTAPNKGIRLLHKELRKLQERYPDEIELLVAEGLPLNEYLRLADSCHVVADQIYSYTPATNALQSMAMGKVVISGGEEEYYRFIGEEKLRPIINLDPRHDNFVDRLEPILLDRADLQRRSREGRRLVERHNDVRIVADRLLSAWERMAK